MAWDILNRAITFEAKKTRLASLCWIKLELNTRKTNEEREICIKAMISIKWNRMTATTTTTTNKYYENICSDDHAPLRCNLYICSCSLFDWNELKFTISEQIVILSCTNVSCSFDNLFRFEFFFSSVVRFQKIKRVYFVSEANESVDYSQNLLNRSFTVNLIRNKIK